VIRPSPYRARRSPSSVVASAPVLVTLALCHLPEHHR
jgi:hypothetical protein